MGGRRHEGGGREGARLNAPACSSTLLTQRTAWPVYEQVFLAALDLGETLLAEVSDARVSSFPIQPPTHHPNFPPFLQQTALGLVQKQFPDSARVRRLEGMQCEAEGDFEGAASVYLNLRERYPTDPVSLSSLFEW